jgi:Bacterial SH3 domain
VPTVVLRLLGRLPVLCLLAGIAGAALAEPVTLERDSVLRAEPRADSAAVTNLARGATGEAVARQGAWVQIKSGAATGWLYSFNVRFGAVEGAGGAGSGSVLGRLFGPRERVSVTSTIGIRGLDEEDLKQARFDGSQLQALDGFAATREQAEAHAGSAGLSASRIEYLAQPERGMGSGDQGGTP